MMRTLKRLVRIREVQRKRKVAALQRTRQAVEAAVADAREAENSIRQLAETDALAAPELERRHHVLTGAADSLRRAQRKLTDGQSELERANARVEQAERLEERAFKQEAASQRQAEQHAVDEWNTRWKKDA